MQEILIGILLAAQLNMTTALSLINTLFHSKKQRLTF